jgi:hypothetical protein
MTNLIYSSSPEIVFFSLFVGTTVILAYSLINSIRDNSSNSNSDNQKPDLGNSTNNNSDVGTPVIPEDVNTQTTVLPVSETNTHIPDTNIPTPNTTVDSLPELPVKEIVELFSKEIQENRITEDEVVQVLKSLDLTGDISGLNVNEIFDMMHAILFYPPFF